MYKKVFLSPFFMPVAFFVLWIAIMGGICCFADDVLLQTKDGMLVDVLAKMGYLLLIVTLFFFANDFSDKVCSWGMYIFLTMSCFLRESGIQHHLSTTDTTPFKSRFFLNPNNPLYEKMIFGFILLMVAGCVIYLTVKYAKYLVRSFCHFDTISWSVAVLCTVGVVMKMIDRFPANYKNAYHEHISDDAYLICQLVEESGEMFLPYIAIAILFQHHLLRKGLA